MLHIYIFISAGIIAKACTCPGAFANNANQRLLSCLKKIKNLCAGGGEATR